MVALGQYLSILFVGVISEEMTDEKIANIANIDAALIAMLSLISIGIGQYFPKYLSNPDTYEMYLNYARSLRFALAIVSFIFGLVFMAFLDNVYYGLVFCLAFFVSFGVDYSLYIRGMPVHAAFSALIRQAGVYSVLLCLFYLFKGFEENVEIIMILSVVVFSIVASIYSLRLLSLQMSFDFRMLPIRDLMNVLSLGGVFFFYSLSKTLVIPVADKYLEPNDVVDLYIITKIYFLFFSIRRVFVQVVHSRLISFKKSVMLSIPLMLASLIFIFIVWILSINNMNFYNIAFNINVGNPVAISLMFVAIAFMGVFSTRILIEGFYGFYKLIITSSSIIFLILVPLATIKWGVLGAVFVVCSIEAAISGVFFFKSYLKFEKEG